MTVIVDSGVQSERMALLVHERSDTRAIHGEGKMNATIAGRMKREKRRGERRCSNARLDDLSTYGKIAFYKLVSRKELEGIADEGW